MHMDLVRRGHRLHVVVSVGIIVSLVLSIFGLIMVRPQNVLAATANIAIVSGVGTPIVGVYNNAAHTGGVYVDLSSAPLSAVRAQEPDPYPDVYVDETVLGEATDSTWDNGVNWFEDNFSSADWIWETDRATGPNSYLPSSPLYDADASISGRVVLFESTFELAGPATAAVLHIAADNGWEAWVNNGTHYYSDTVSGLGWAASDLHEASLNSTGWQSYGTISIPASEFSVGTNVLHVLAGNEYFAADDVDYPNTEVPASKYNPGAAIFQLDVTYETPDWGTLEVIKHTTGGDGTFAYTVSGGPTAILPFNITTSSGVGSYSVPVIAGSYTVTEGTLPAGWISNDPDMVEIAVVPSGGTATVTFTNRGLASLTVTKALVIPNGVLLSGIDTTFIVHVSGPSGTFDHTFTVTDGLVVGAPWTLTNLLSGSYTATEDNYAPLWTTGILASSATLTPGGSGSVAVVNTYHPGKIIVDKVTIPGASLESFEFHLSCGANFFLADATAPNDSGWLAPGTYSVAELAKTGWDLISAEASDGSPITALVLGPGETITVTFTNTQRGIVTRTQGFWSTHLEFTTGIFENHLGSHIDLGWKIVTNMKDLMGIFWANNAKTSTGAKRSTLCQAKEIASNQALAAILNSAMPGGAPLPAGYSLTQIAGILGGTDIDAIKALNSALDMFNNSGDNVALNPTLPSTGRANPQGAKSIANIPFADCP